MPPSTWNLGTKIKFKSLVAVIAVLYNYTSRYSLTSFDVKSSKSCKSIFITRTIMDEDTYE
jgi:hypothetical protein